MTRILHRLSLGLTALLLLGALPLTALAQGSRASSTCPAPAAHSLPKSSATPVTIFRFGVQGGSLRPWSVKLTSDGAITPTGISTARQQLTDAAHSLKGLLALADAGGFFSLKKTTGCLGAAGNPDVSHHFIAIRTSKGTKHVDEFGSCKATAAYDELFAVLQEVAGLGG
jgi:hypothetical protein